MPSVLKEQVKISKEKEVLNASIASYGSAGGVDKKQMTSMD